MPSAAISSAMSGEAQRRPRGWGGCGTCQPPSHPVPAPRPGPIRPVTPKSSFLAAKHVVSGLRRPNWPVVFRAVDCLRHYSAHTLPTTAQWPPCTPNEPTRHHTSASDCLEPRLISSFAYRRLRSRCWHSRWHTIGICPPYSGGGCFRLYVRIQLVGRPALGATLRPLSIPRWDFCDLRLPHRRLFWLRYFDARLPRLLSLRLHHQASLLARNVWVHSCLYRRRHWFLYCSASSPNPRKRLKKWMQVTAQTITLNALQWLRLHTSRMGRVHTHVQDVPTTEPA